MKQSRSSSAEFDSVAAALAQVTTRSEITVRSMPAPAKLAPYALALNAEVVVAGSQVADGRLVILHDPYGQDAWNGTWRVVLFASAELDETMASDPVLNDMGWTWLQESLGERDLAVSSFGGTVTRTESVSFGTLGDRPANGELEIRASWTAVVDAPHPSLRNPSTAAIMTAHVMAWIDLLGLITSLDPAVEGVVRLQPRA
jgi:hypothetical protein